MPKATFPVGAVERPISSNEELERIAASLQVLSRAFTQARAHEQLLKDAGVRLDRAGAALLYQLHIHADHSLHVSKLAELLGIDAPAVTRKVQLLQRLGFVSTSLDSEDKRAKHVHLTRIGEVTLDRLLEANKRRLAGLFGEWTSEELRHFSSSLRRFAKTLTSELETYRG